MPLYLVPPASASLPKSPQASSGVPCRCCPAARAGLEARPGRITREALPP